MTVRTIFKFPSITLAAALVLTALAPNTALSQTAKPAQQECDVDPSQKGGRVPKEGDNLTGKLDACNGVLKAPEAGDQGIVTPAPDTGNSRVIKPGDVPEGANPSNGTSGSGG